jgi:hypothetical protein
MVGVRICAAALSVALVSLPLVAADKVPVPAPAPVAVPAQILTARKVFISNAGTDGEAVYLLGLGGDAYHPYNLFYAAMKSWGRFEIVDAPSDADLVLEIRFNGQTADAGMLLVLTILDSKTHFILWTISEPVQGWARKPISDKSFGQGIANLVGDLKALGPQPAAGGGVHQ